MRCYVGTNLVTLCHACFAGKKRQIERNNVGYFGRIFCLAICICIVLRNLTRIFSVGWSLKWNIYFEVIIKCEVSYNWDLYYNSLRARNHCYSETISTVLKNFTYKIDFHSLFFVLLKEQRYEHSILINWCLFLDFWAYVFYRF